jgi:gliding motility-associated lipoprotein GldD
MNLLRNSLLIFFLVSAAACNSTYTSKKRGYYKIDFPQRSYQLFNDPAVPYSFEYPSYAKIVTDSTYFDSTPENPYWRNIDFPQFNARIFLSYKIIGGKATYKIKNADGSYRDSVGINYFDQMVNDAFKLTNKNEAVASFIGDSVFTTKNGVTGVNFTVKGNAATARQFFMSDSNRHFIRGALYFDTTPNADSLKPVLDFLQTDINHMINSFRWKNI